MDGKLIWKSNATQDYIRGLDDEAKKNALIDRGYDDEMLDDMDSAIDQDNYMGQDDAEEFEREIVPMLNAQTNGHIIAVNVDDPQGELLVIDAEDLISGDICPDAVQQALHDTPEGLEMNYYDKDGHNCLTLALYAVPNDEDTEALDKIMPDLHDDFVDPDDDDPYLNPGVDLTDANAIEDMVDVNALKQFGTRLVNQGVGHLGEDLDEAKSKSPTNLEDELRMIQQEYEAEGPEAFYRLPFDEFERQYPEFTKSVIKTFLKEVVGLTKSELNELGDLVDEDTGDPYWETGELITDQDWPCLLEGAGMLANGNGIQWEKLYKKYYKSYDESLTEETCDECNEQVDKGIGTDAATNESIENHYDPDDYDEEEHEVRLDDGSGHSTSLVPESLEESKGPKVLDTREEAQKGKPVEPPYNKRPEEAKNRKLKKEELDEDFQMIQLTPNDQATNIRALIKSCWDSVDQFSMFAQQLNEFGSQMALTTVNTLINDLYIAIGSFEEELSTVDPKSTALDAIDQVQAVAQVAPQVATQMAVQPVMIEKFQLSEDLEEPIEEAYIRKEIESKELWGYINQVLKRFYRRLEDEDGIIDPYDIAQILKSKYNISGADNDLNNLVEDIVDALHWYGKDELSKYNLQLKQAPDTDYYLVPTGFEFEESLHEEVGNIRPCSHCGADVDLDDRDTDQYWTNDGDRIVYHICPECGDSVEEIGFDESLKEDLDEKPEAQEELEEPIKKELKEVEKYRKEKVKDSMNPDPEDTIEETTDMTMVEDLGKDESYNPKFFESLLKLED